MKQFHHTTVTEPDDVISVSQVKRGTGDEAIPSRRAVAVVNRSCISLIADNASDRSTIARSNGTTSIRGSASTCAKRAATDGTLVLPASTAQQASAARYVDPPLFRLRLRFHRRVIQNSHLGPLRQLRRAFQHHHTVLHSTGNLHITIFSRRGARRKPTTARRRTLATPASMG